MSVETIKPTAVACCLNRLSDCAANIKAGWKRRWKMEMPGWCFRGADDQTFDLNPGLLRRPYPEAPADLARCERQLFREFGLRSKPLLGFHPARDSVARLIMQQHGLPTRLLDWSTAMAVGAYFAVRSLEESEKDGAVWVMASRHLMEKNGYTSSWRTIIGDPVLERMETDCDTKDYHAFNSQHPAVVSPDQLIPRIIVQHSIYTLHTFQRDALERLAHLDRETNGDLCFLHKIIIPASAKSGFRSELSVMAGISEETLFPDIDGFARAFVCEQRRIAAGEIGPTSRIGKTETP